MKKTLFVCTFILLFYFESLPQKNYILPEPQKIDFPESEQNGFRLSKKSSIEGKGVDLSKSYIDDFKSFISYETGFSLSDKVNKKSNILLVIEEGIHDLGDEGYKISIIPKDNLKVEATTEKGLFYGIQTLKQIFYFSKKKRDDENFTDFDIEVQVKSFIKSSTTAVDYSSGLATRGYKRINEQGYFQGVEEVQTKSLNVYNIPPMIIEDFPRFKYRGMMLDVSRHFMPVEFVKRYIDIISMHKMNKFHWHLTDDQGWRIEIKKYPKLTEIGSKRTETLKGHARFAGNNPKFDGVPHEGFYTQDEVKDIVKYANDRFVDVIPEIDMPGHTSALIAAYPEYGTSSEKVDVKKIWGVHDEILKPTDETFKFIEDIILELKELFPSSYFHVGGDEAKKTQWENSVEIQKLMADLEIEEEDSLQSYFIGRVEKILSNNGKKLIGWEEIIEGGLNERIKSK